MRDSDAVMQTAIENAVYSTKLEIAKSFILNNIPIEIIIETTGLTKKPNFYNKVAFNYLFEIGRSKSKIFNAPFGKSVIYSV